MKRINITLPQIMICRSKESEKKIKMDVADQFSCGDGSDSEETILFKPTTASTPQKSPESPTVTKARVASKGLYNIHILLRYL